MPRSIRSYQREIATLKSLVQITQWVCPSYNGSDSCTGCGQQRHMLCDPGCPVAKITGDYGRKET